MDWKQISLSAVISYVISWVYFFLALPAFQGAFGSVKGGVLCYATSWAVWIGAGYMIHVKV